MKQSNGAPSVAKLRLKISKLNDQLQVERFILTCLQVLFSIVSDHARQAGETEAQRWTKSVEITTRSWSGYQEIFSRLI